MGKLTKPCRECRHEIFEHAQTCPQCGAPKPGKENWDGWGYEYKSQATLFGIPLLHISFKYLPGGRPVPALGVVAIGQFACGLLTLSQFGVGLVSVSQITVAGYALAQIGVAYSLIAQVGLYINEGYGQTVKSVAEFLGQF